MWLYKSQIYYAKSRKPYSKGYIVYEFTYAILEKANKKGQ